MTATPPFTLDAKKPDPDINTDSHIPTKAERIANYQAIMKMHPANRFRLMFGQALLPEPVVKESFTTEQPRTPR